MFCSNCGKEISDGAKFCPHCGKSVGGEKSALADGKEKASGAAVSAKEKIKNALGSGVSTVLALAIVVQIGFLYMANHNAKSVQVVKSAEVAGMAWEDAVASMMAKPKWSVEKMPSDGTRFVRVTGYLLDTQTGEKLKTKLHFSVKDVWGVSGETEISLDSVYIKGYGEGTDAMRAFNQLLYSVR